MNPLQKRSSTSSINPTNNNTPQNAPTYFVDQKKGEVNELKTLLRNINVERDPKRKREVIKKVIAYMALGVDVSRLFTEMIMAIETRDLVVKKMVYLYLCNYAHEKPDLAIMCVNTLQRDCASEDPMVRGLALRSLCSLRLTSMVEYISEPLKNSLTDVNAYVRKTGMIGILKLYNLNSRIVKESNMIDLLYNMLQDPDGQVVANCIMVLNEIMADEGGMAINRAIILHLLNRLQDFNEWGLSQVLDLLCKYTPVDEDESFNIMNLLDPLLRTSNSGVVLATIKCFMHFTTNLPELHFQVYERTRDPLLTLIGNASPELSYCLLKHIEIIAEKCPGVFDSEFRHFYTRHNEPAHTKYVKINLLSHVANEQNVSEILDELGEYVADIDSEIARRSIRSIGHIATRITESTSVVVEKLVEFLDIEIDHVRAETVIVMKDILRKYPDRRRDVLPSLNRCLRRIEDPTGKAAVVWMVGEYGTEIIEAPYMLERLIDSYDDQPIEVKKQLLVASMKLFAKRAPEMQSMLGRLLAAVINDNSDQDLHDRGLLYYRLLKLDVRKAIKYVNGEGPQDRIVRIFTEDSGDGKMAKLLEEFNTLSIMYGKTSETFIFNDSNDLDTHSVNHPEAVENQNGNESEEEEDDDGNDHDSPHNEETQEVYSNNTDSNYITNDLLLDNLTNSIQLISSPVMDSATFQSKWGQISTSSSIRVQARNLVPFEEIERRFSANNIFTIASGDLENISKFFFYGQGTDEVFYFVQCIFEKPTKTFNFVCKSTSHQNEQFQQYLQNIVDNNFA